MGVLFSHWLRYLESNQGTLGLILVAVGLSFLLTGWRFRRASMVVVFALVGAVVGCCLGFNSMNMGWFALAGVGVATVVGLLAGRNGGPVLGSFLGGWAVWGVLESTRLPTPVTLIIVALAAIGVAGVTLTHKRETTIVLTSLAGAAILVSGVIALVGESHTLETHYRAMTSNVLFFPFAIIVPTVCGILLQMADVRRDDGGEVKL